jgi:hypothetical protein
MGRAVTAAAEIARPTNFLREIDEDSFISPSRGAHLQSQFRIPSGYLKENVYILPQSILAGFVPLPAVAQDLAAQE